MKKILLLYFTLVSISSAVELSLEKSIELFKQNNRKLREKQVSIEQKNLIRNSKVKAGLPALRLENNYIDHDNSKNIESSFQNGLYIAQPLFNGGEIYYNAKNAKLQKELEENDYSNLEVQLKLNVIQAYINCLQLERELEVYETSKVEKTNELKKQNEFFKLNLIDRSELLKIEASLYQTETAILKIQNNIDAQKLNLKTLLGIDLNENISLKEINFNSSSINNIDLAKDIKNAINNGILTKKLDKNIEISNVNAKSSRSSLLPKVNLEYGYESLENSSFSKTNDDWQWRVGVNLKWDIFNFGSGLDTFNESNLEIEKQQISKTDELEILKKEINISYLNLITSLETIKTNKKTLIASQESYSIDKEKFANRLIDAIDFLKTESSLRESQIAYINSQLDSYLYYEQYLSLLQ
ncbi:TolC family protein [Cetobacterium sp. 8H]|uniref:TolC family protein n=1 Tax=Cetobacterium sp. 8H TaxID=2759681 RepID=UPI00163D2354|nr:TolC family protein [Cetobacterium sp. 8H]MBC2851800.1 TolC family protein [Cetobacterium sp. 8H]